MTKIGIVSDTHNFYDNRLFNFLDKCDQIWHAGDIGNLETAEQFAAIKPFKAVFGNIDGTDVRSTYPENLKFNCENVNVFITHIGGYPGKYSKNAFAQLINNPPDLFICGHSHILKVIYDTKLNFLCINPGAAGKYGFHTLQTAIRFDIDGRNIMNLEIIELPK